MREGSQKVTNDDEGERGVTIPPKIDDVIYEQPLMVLHSFACHCIVLYGIVLYLTVLHGIALLASARGLYLARHLSTLFYYYY